MTYTTNTFNDLWHQYFYRVNIIADQYAISQKTNIC